VFIQRKIGQLQTWDETRWLNLGFIDDYPNRCHSHCDVFAPGIFSVRGNKFNCLPDNNGSKSIREKKGMRTV